MQKIPRSKFLLFSFEKEVLLGSIFSQGAGMEQGAEQDMERQISSNTDNRKVGNGKCGIPHAKLWKNDVENVHYPVSW